MWSHELEWLAILLRWAHVIIGVMWIGASFYLISWENKFNRSTGLREGIEGNFWTIQGGDFYYVEKLENAPARLPDELHWFKYEAYLTWLSGFCLLCLVFYVDAGAMLINPNAAGLSPALATGTGIASLLLCWLLYSFYCRTPLAKNFRLSALVGLVFVALLGYLFTQLFSPRAAFIHVGAVLGTLMSGNVFFVIIPWHKALISAIENQQPLDKLYACRPGFRSRHNHYMTLPVLFIMLGSHFPLAFNQPAYWAVIAAVALAAGLLKHYHNLLQQKLSGWPYLLAGIGIFVGLVYATAPPTLANSACRDAVTTEQAFAVMESHCRTCHSSRPTDPAWQAAPNGVMFDSPEQIARLKDRILQRAVLQQTMPLGNKQNMQAQERQLLGCWASQRG